MLLFFWISGVLLALIWGSRALGGALGMRSIADLARPEFDRTPEPAPLLTVVVPACNEQESVGIALKSLIASDYPRLEVIAVNDRSTDATGAILDQLADAHPERLRVVHVTELPPGWMGKTHAMWLGAQQGSGEWILFTDADVIFRPDALRRALAQAQAEAADHFVLYPTLLMESPGERMMISAFQIMFVISNRAWKVADPDARDSVGVGAFNLIRRSAYEQLGTYAALRLQVIDDMMLGRMVKRYRLRQRNAFGYGLVNVRWARGARGVVHNLTKNFFALMGFRWPMTLLAILAVAFLNLVPFVGTAVAPGAARLPHVAALIFIAGFYLGNWRLNRISPAYFFLHPVASVMMIYAMLRSTVLTLARGGVLWRGTLYPLNELRREVGRL